MVSVMRVVIQRLIPSQTFSGPYSQEIFLGERERSGGGCSRQFSERPKNLDYFIQELNFLNLISESKINTIGADGL